MKLMETLPRKHAPSARSISGHRWVRDLGRLGHFQAIPYSDQDHETWRLLFLEQRDFLRAQGSALHLEGYEQLGLRENIPPDLEAMNRRLHTLCGWRLVEVDGMVDNLDYFHLTGQSIQPFTPLIRGPEERHGYAWPDIFHELCHLPPLLNPHYASFARQLGSIGEKAQLAGDTAFFQKIIRIYWHLIEYGILAQGLEIYGALLSGHPAEAHHVRGNPQLLREYNSLEQVASTPLPWELEPNFDLSHFQKNYFVVPSFLQLSQDIAKLSPS